MRGGQLLISFLLVLFVFSFLPANSFAKKKKNRTAKKIERILNKKVFDDACVGIEIFNATKNKFVFRKNSRKLFTPASNLKLLTTSAALCFIPDYKFETKILSNGVIVDSVLLGDLIFRGGGDPLFSYAELDSLLSEFVNLGVKEIRGNIVGDVSWSDSLYFGKGWMWDDNPEPFMPYLSPLALEEATVRIIVKPSASFSLANIEVYPPTSEIKATNKILTVKEDTTYFTIERNWQKNDNAIFADGFISANSEPDTTYLNLFAPEKIFLSVAKENLENKGVRVAGEIKVKRGAPYVKEFFTFEREIDSVIFKANKESDNFCAEMLLRALANEFYGKPATAEKGAMVIDSLISLIGEDPKKFEIVDGSGISRYNLILPDLIVKILNYLRTEKPRKFEFLVQTLPVMGVDGTLEERHKKGFSYGNVRAKTGTMSSVSSLSGVLKNKSGDALIFSMMMQNFSAPVSVIRFYQDVICEILAKSK